MRNRKLVQYWSAIQTFEMNLWSKIAKKNVLQVYVTTTTIFYTILSQKVRTPQTLGTNLGVGQ